VEDLLVSCEFARLAIATAALIFCNRRRVSLRSARIGAE
jgi:hypothetical protein